jgi:hypothetical protein
VRSRAAEEKLQAERTVTAKNFKIQVVAPDAGEASALSRSLLEPNHVSSSATHPCLWPLFVVDAVNLVQ